MELREVEGERVELDMPEHYLDIYDNDAVLKYYVDFFKEQKLAHDLKDKFVHLRLSIRTTESFYTPEEYKEESFNKRTQSILEDNGHFICNILLDDRKEDLQIINDMKYEVYHIAKGHVNKEPPGFWKLLYYELFAMCYAKFG